MKILVLLQNAYYNVDKETSSRIGHPLFVTDKFHDIKFHTPTDWKLQKMLPKRMIIIYGNASPKIGTHADSYYPYEKEHVALLLQNYKPDIVLLCGREAHKAKSLVDVPYLKIPHPGARFISNKFCKETKINIVKMIIKIMMG